VVHKAATLVFASDVVPPGTQALPRLEAEFSLSQPRLGLDPACLGLGLGLD